MQQLREIFLPFSYEEITRYAKSVDVIWFNLRKIPCAFYEIEHSMDFKNSLNKFYELQDFRSQFVIVTDEKRKNNTKM